MFRGSGGFIILRGGSDPICPGGGLVRFRGGGGPPCPGGGLIMFRGGGPGPRWMLMLRGRTCPGLNDCWDIT